MTVTASRPYPLDNDHPDAADHHQALGALLDPFSYERTIELIDLPGKACLDVGAGAGSFALHLANAVRPFGHVMATDINPRHIPTHRNLVTADHDITTDPIPEHFDYIHARLVLAHLPEPDQTLNRLIDALHPDGTILIEDWDHTRTDMILHAPTLEAAELYTLYQETLTNQIYPATGTDHTWPRRIHATMLNQGLTAVETVIHATAWTGGSPGCQHIHTTITQLRDQLLHAGLTAEQLHQLQQLLRDPQLVLAGHPLYSTSGRRNDTATGDPA